MEYVGYAEECIPFLENFLEIYPHSGIALLTLGGILLDRISNDEKEINQNVEKFLSFVQTAYDRLAEKKRGLVPGLVSNPKDREVSEIITKPEDLIDAFRDDLYTKSTSLQYDFLDLVTRMPCFNPNTGWTRTMLRDYLSHNWGNVFLDIGVFSPGAVRDWEI